MNMTTYGLDVAKRVFQLYWVDAASGEISNRRFGRDELIRFLAQRAAGRVALEACGSGHWWARKIKALGHDVEAAHAMPSPKQEASAAPPQRPAPGAAPAQTNQPGSPGWKRPGT